MRFKRRMKVGSTIFTGTMADIVFLLLVFFMTTTIFREEEGLRVRFPQARHQVMSELGKQFLTVTVWVKQVDPGNDESEVIARIGDFDMPMLQVAEQLDRLSDRFWREQNKHLDVVVFNVDTRVPMGRMVSMFNAMRFEEIYSIQFNAEDIGLF